MLTSTFPRWKKDSTPGFVRDFCSNILPHTESVKVLAPHYQGAAKKENLNGVNVKRFRYWWPASGETIAYDGGGVSKIGSGLFYMLKLKCYLVSLLFNTLRLSVKNKPIINAHWLIPQGFIAVLVKMLTGRRVVVTIHGSDVFMLNGKIFNIIKRFTLKKADTVVVNSSATKKACEEIFPNRSYSVIPMGVDVDMFSNTSSGEKIKNKYKLDKFTILFVGRLSEEKGVIYLLEALDTLKKEGRDFKAIIVGDGLEKKGLKHFASSCDLGDRVIFTGWIDSHNIMSYYSAADVFVGPSIVSETGRREAFGLVFAESLATGTPVIATNTGGIKDIVIDGKNGYLISDKNSIAIADKLRIVMNDETLLEKMQVNARDHVVNNFSWEVVSKKYSQVFDNIVKS